MIKLIAVAVALLLLLMLGRYLTIGDTAMTRHRAWAMRWRVWLRLRPGDGFASMTELQLRYSRAAAALTHGRRARPSLTRLMTLTMHTTAYAVRFGRAQWGRRVYGRMQDQTLILSPQQMGKSGVLADRMIDHPGPIICTSTRDDLLRNTIAERGQLGPVHVFNPLHIGRWPSSFGWPVIEGCADPATAVRRAQDLTGDYPTGDMKWWQSKASAALASLLYAADLSGWATITDVYGWVNRHNDKQAEEVLLATDRVSRPLLAMLQELRKPGRTSDSVRATIGESLTWVAIPALAKAANPAPGEEFRTAEFLNDNGTLYLIAPGNETAPVAPLFAAFVQDVHYQAGLIASRLPEGKLDPPLWYALDEVTQVCPLPLPQMLADSAGKGILMTAVVHSYGQLEARWEKSGAETVWATSSTKVLFGGITDPVTLEHVTRLCGTVRAGDQDLPALPPELLRMLPKYRALILTLDRRPVIVKTRPAWHRFAWRTRRRPPVPPVSSLADVILATVPSIPIDETAPLAWVEDDEPVSG
jgi:hypothetical protein